MITKVISGGQTGADQAGLRAAKSLGIPTGGTAPHDFFTESGSNYNLRDEFNLEEGPYDPRVYPARTKMNVRNSDGTVAFGYMDSPGERLTRSVCVSLFKPYIANPTHEEFIDWVVENNIHILNVAGNRESTNPGIGTRVEKFLKEVLR